MHPPTKRFEGTYSLSNWLVGILLFLSWIGCIVGFAGPLHIVRTGKGPLSFYWDHVRFTGNIRPYETILPGNVQFQNENEVAEMCDSGGAGFLAMTVFAFICLTAALGLWLLRTLNIKMKINREDSLKAEIALTACAFMFMLIAVIVWGATCYSYSNSRMNLTAVPRGWVYMIFTLFFMIGAIPLLTWMLRKTKYEPGLADMSARPELAYPDWHGWEESWFRRPAGPTSTSATAAERERAGAVTGRDTRDRDYTARDRDRGLTTGATGAAAMTGLAGATSAERERDRDRELQQMQQQMRDRSSTSAAATGFGREDWERDRGLTAARQTEQEQRRDQPYMSALSYPGVSMASMGPTDRDMRGDTRDRDRGYFYEDRSRAPEKGWFGRERLGQREREPDYSAAMHAGYPPSRDRTGLRDYADQGRDREQDREMMSMQRPQALSRPMERPTTSGVTESQPSQAHIVPIQTHSMLRDRDRDMASAAATSATSATTGSIPVSVSQSQTQAGTPSSASVSGAAVTDTTGSSSIPIHGIQQSPRQSRVTVL